MEKYICERTEEGIAVFEKDNGEYVKVPVCCIKSEITEGGVYLYDGENYILSHSETQARRSRLLALQKKISEKG